MEELLTWELLQTNADAVMATAMLTQLLKELRFLKKIPTRLLCYGMACLILLLAAVFTCGLTLSRLALVPINAAFVSFASNGAYDAMRKQSPPPPVDGAAQAAADRAL